MRRVWKLGWRLGVCFVLLVWIFHSIFMSEARSAWAPAEGDTWAGLDRWTQWELAWSLGPGNLWDTVRLVDGGWLALSLVFMGLTLAIGIVRWRAVLGGLGLAMPLGRTAEISLVAHFFNSFLLGSTGGDLLKAYYAARETHHRKAEAVATVVVDRLVGLFSMLAFAVIMLAAHRDLLADHRPLAAAAWAVGVMFVACSLAVLLFFWGGLSWLWPRARVWLRRLPRGDLLERSLEAARMFGRTPGLVFRAAGLSLLLNGVCVLQVLALARGMGVEVEPGVLLMVVPVVVCLSAVPITPSGLGVRENLYVLLLSDASVQVPATAALSISLLAYAGSLCWSLVGGAFYLGLRERRHLAEVTGADENDAEGAYGEAAADR